MGNVNIGSDFKWMIGLHTPVDLGCSFRGEDLVNSGINFDTNISIINADNAILSRKTLLDDLGEILGNEDFENLIKLCSAEDNEKPVFDLFELNSVDGLYSDFVVLRLREDSDLYNKIKVIYKSLCIKYKIAPDKFFPKITLAEVRKGRANKYIFSGNLRLILNDSAVDPEDLALTVCNRDEKERTFYLTHFKNIDRYFRLRHLEEDNKELFKDEGLNYVD